MGVVIPILVLSVICGSAIARPYSKYGRTCNDIGCPSTEVCVMTADSCNYGQQDGKECGRYPTCKRSSSGAGQSPDSNSHNPSDTTSYNPPKPNFPYNGGGSTNHGGSNLYPSIDDIKPATLPPVPPANYPGGSAYNPGGGGYKPPSTNYGGGGSSYPGSNNGGGSNYPGSSGGGSSYGGGGSSYGGGGGSSYGGGGGSSKPASSSGGGAFSGILSGIQGFLSGQVGQFLKNTISGNKGASSSTGSTTGGNPLSGLGSLGSLANLGGFDAKSILSQKNFGLFNENKPGDRNTGTTQNHGTSRSSSSGANYPTQPSNGYAGNYNYNRASQTNAGYSPSQSRATPTTAPKYGWNV